MKLSLRHATARHPVLAVAAALAFGSACGEKGEVAPGSAYQDKVAALIPRIETVTGMKFRGPPKVATKTAEEVKVCLEFLKVTAPPDAARSRENLILVLFNHHDFVTIR